MQLFKISIDYILILQVGSYNEYVEEKYKLPYPDDTLGLFVNSIPDMWEKAFIAFIKTQTFNEEENPLHQCMIYNFDKVKQVIKETLSLFHCFISSLFCFCKSLKSF